MDSEQTDPSNNVVFFRKPARSTRRAGLKLSATAAESLRLVQAFMQIDSAEHRQAVIDLAERLAVESLSDS